RTPLREPLARKPIRGKSFTQEFHCHRDFPACACAQSPQHVHGIVSIVLVATVRAASRLRILSAQARTTGAVVSFRPLFVRHFATLRATCPICSLLEA